MLDDIWVEECESWCGSCGFCNCHGACEEYGCGYDARQKKSD